MYKGNTLIKIPISEQLSKLFITSVDIFLVINPQIQV